MHLNLQGVADWMRSAVTEELLDRVTVFRDEMEPAAVDLIEGELARRGVSATDVLEHDLIRRERLVTRTDGTAVRCSFCERPAVAEARGWIRLFGWIPILPKLFAHCDEHAPPPTDPPGEPTAPDRGEEP